MTKFMPTPRRISPANSNISHLNSEEGGARLNLLIVLFIIVVGAYSVMNYAPVAYQSSEYKDVMQSKVDQAVAFGYTGEWVATQLRASANQYGVPPEATITAVQKNGRMEAAVRYTRPIPMPGFIYDYEFDHTARSTNALNNSTALNN
jgi:hypothetical protein